MERMEFVNISEDEDDDIAAIGAGMPLRQIVNRRSSESIILPIPSPSGRPMAPINFPALNVSPPSSDSSGDSVGSPSSRYLFPRIPLGHSNRQVDSPSLPSINPPAAPIGTGTDQENAAAINHFMNRINAGHEIQCLLCAPGTGILEHQLMKHICEEHFFGYRPYKCSECEFRTGDLEVLATTHFLDTGHHRGVNRYETVAERNGNIEFVIRMLYTHALFAHGRPEGDRRLVLERMKNATRILRLQRQQPAQDGPISADDDEFEDKEPSESVAVPVSPCVSEPPTGEDQMVTSTSSSSPAPAVHLMPVPITHRLARKSIVRPLSCDSRSKLASPDSGRDHLDNGLKVMDWSDSDQENKSASIGNASEAETDRQSAASEPSAQMPPAVTDKAGISAVSPPPVLEMALPAVEIPARVGSTSSTPSPALASPTVKSQAAQLICEFCRLGFPNLVSLKPHFQRDHAGGYVPYKCTEADCNYGGQWRERLVRSHIQDEHGIKVGKVAITKPTPEQRAQLELIMNSLMAKGIPVEEMKKVCDG